MANPGRVSSGIGGSGYDARFGLNAEALSTVGDLSTRQLVWPKEIPKLPTHSPDKRLGRMTYRQGRFFFSHFSFLSSVVEYHFKIWMYPYARIFLSFSVFFEIKGQSFPLSIPPR